MAILKMINNCIDSNENLMNVCRYVTNVDKSFGNLIDGRNIDYHNAFVEMNSMQKMHGKAYGRLAYHFVVSFDKGEVFTPSEAFDIAYDLSEYFSDEYQIIYAVHTEQNHLHIHFVLNTVSLDTGSKFHFDYKNLNDFKCFVDRTVTRHLWQ